MILMHRKSRLRKDIVMDIPLSNSLTAITGSSPTLTRASVATYVSRDGVLTDATTDEARFERNGLLIEPAATNLIVDSADLTAASWTAVQSTIVQSGVAPDGSASSYKITATDAAAGALYAIAPTTGACFSVWLKRGNVSAAAIASEAEELTLAVLTDEWQRFYVNCPLTSEFFVIAASTTGGNATSGDYIYAAFAQVESGTFPTSFIRTSGGTATRAKDVCSVSAANVPASNADYVISVEYDIIGHINGAAAQAVWTVEGETLRYLFADKAVLNGTIDIAFVSGALITDRILNTVTDKAQRVVCRMDAGASAGESVMSVFHQGTKSILSGVSGFPAGAKTTLSIGSTADAGQLCGHIRRLTVYNRALTDRECLYA